MEDTVMGTTTVRSGCFTYDDFCALVRDDQKADLIDGVIYMASPESLEVNELFLWLITVMRLYVSRNKLGRIYGSRVACRLDDKNAPEPDILFVAEKNRGRLKRNHVEGPPDLAIEIVSPESVERDYDKKRRQYQRFGIPEYWIIDEHERKVTLLRRDARGKYREVAARKGIFHSQALEGFWLDPNWLWEDPLPDELDILKQLLGELA
jgi:Uma2 family endonuclease